MACVSAYSTQHTLVIVILICKYILKVKNWPCELFASLIHKKCIINTKKRHILFLNCYIKLEFDKLTV